MSDSMQIESLWRFNAKFDPDWLPRYAVYDSPEYMLTSAMAVAKAESFWELPVIGRFFKPKQCETALPAAPGTISEDEPADSAPNRRRRTGPNRSAPNRSARPRRTAASRA